MERTHDGARAGLGWAGAITAAVLCWSIWARPDIAVSLVVLGAAFTVVEAWRPLRPGRAAGRRPGAVTDTVGFVVTEVLAALGVIVVLFVSVPIRRLGMAGEVARVAIGRPGWVRWPAAFVLAEVA
jgi:hypothetical protein